MPIILAMTIKYRSLNTSGFLLVIKYNEPYFSLSTYEEICNRLQLALYQIPSQHDIRNGSVWPGTPTSYKAEVEMTMTALDGELVDFNVMWT